MHLRLISFRRSAAHIDARFSRTSEMDFKVEEPWNKTANITETVTFSARWQHFNSFCFETLFFFFPLLFLFVFATQKKKGGGGAMPPFPSPNPVLLALFGIKRISLYLFYTDYFNRFSIKTYNWRFYQKKGVM